MVFVPLSLRAQTPAERSARSQIVSIGDVMRWEDSHAVKTKTRTVAVSTGGTAATVVTTTALPIHIIYVHGINQVGGGDSKMLRTSICRYLHECLVEQAPRHLYAQGPFAVGAAKPQLEYLGQPVWASQEEFSASAPYIDRYRISGKGLPPIVLDELNWYPLVYPLKCKFLLPGDDRLAGGRGRDDVCRPKQGTVEDGAGPGRYLSYEWNANGPLFGGDMPQQKGTLINRNLKAGLMDWGFGDATIALGPMGEILCAAIRELFVQSLADVVPGAAGSVGGEEAPVFFVTHSLGSYLSLAAMDSSWLGEGTPELNGFRVTEEQGRAADYLAGHTTGFYFLANQVALLELSQLAPPPVSQGQDCSEPGPRSPAAFAEPTLVAMSHYGRMRAAYLKAHPTSGPQGGGPQIVAWSAADDLLSWYMPKLSCVAVVNLTARNPGFRIPKLVAFPVSVHGNYAENPAVVRGIFGPTRP